MDCSARSVRAGRGAGGTPAAMAIRGSQCLELEKSNTVGGGGGCLCAARSSPSTEASSPIEAACMLDGASLLA